jgi:hypothetical protein
MQARGVPPNPQPQLGGSFFRGDFDYCADTPEARARNVACFRLHASNREIQSNLYSSDVVMMYGMTGE